VIITPFGMQMPGRNASTGEYRYGFQGQETDDEITGSESHVSFTYRCYDARLGRFLSLDPLAPKYPHYSPYAFSGNRVIDRIELEGLEPTKPPMGQQGTDWRVASKGGATSQHNRFPNGVKPTDKGKAFECTDCDGFTYYYQYPRNRTISEEDILPGTEMVDDPRGDEVKTDGVLSIDLSLIEIESAGFDGSALEKAAKKIEDTPGFKMTSWALATDDAYDVDGYSSGSGIDESKKGDVLAGAVHYVSSEASAMEISLPEGMINVSKSELLPGASDAVGENATYNVTIFYNYTKERPQIEVATSRTVVKTRYVRTYGPDYAGTNYVIEDYGDTPPEKR
jgi:RHS repeat-associated protein